MAENIMQEVVVDEENQNWQGDAVERLDPCENRPGLKVMRVLVKDEEGDPMPGIKVRFDVAPSQGIAYDHQNVWGITDEKGYLEWNHLGIPALYNMWLEDDVWPLVQGISTRIGFGYCRPSGSTLGGWRATNRPGVASFWVRISRKQ